MSQVLRTNIARVFYLLEELFELLRLHRNRKCRLDVAARRRGRLLELLIVLRLVEALGQVCLVLSLLRLGHVLRAEQRRLGEAAVNGVADAVGRPRL